LKEEQGSQPYPPMVRGVQPWRWANRLEQSANGKPEDRPMGMDKVVSKETRQMEGTVDAGQSVDNGSRVSFQDVLHSYESSFLFSVVFVFRCK
jgi:hypothetical protein